MFSHLFLKGVITLLMPHISLNSGITLGTSGSQFDVLLLYIDPGSVQKHIGTYALCTSCDLCFLLLCLKSQGNMKEGGDSQAISSLFLSVTHI